MKEDTKNMIKSGLMLIGIIVLIFWWLPNIEGALGIGKNIEKCYPYTNSSGDIQYMFGKCYFPDYHYYETREVCRGGLFGIGQACYESSETHYESYTTTRCIIAKTGEDC